MDLIYITIIIVPLNFVTSIILLYTMQYYVHVLHQEPAWILES